MENELNSLKRTRSFKVIITKSVIFYKTNFPCLSAKDREELADKVFVITKVEFNEQNNNEQTQIEVEQP